MTVPQNNNILSQSWYAESQASVDVGSVNDVSFFQQEEEEQEFPVGYRFCPRDDELIGHYLKRKISGLRLSMNRIPCVNLYGQNPDDLIKDYMPLGDREWYFFTPRDKKYPNGSRPNRAAGYGYWKATGGKKTIIINSKCTGIKQSLVYYRGKSPGTKTSWIMHEYMISDVPVCTPKHSKDMKLDDWVLCRIHRKENKAKTGEAVGSVSPERKVLGKRKTSDINPNYVKVDDNHINDNHNIGDYINYGSQDLSYEYDDVNNTAPYYANFSMDPSLAECILENFNLDSGDTMIPFSAPTSTTFQHHHQG